MYNFSKKNPKEVKNKNKFSWNPCYWSR